MRILGLLRRHKHHRNGEIAKDVEEASVGAYQTLLSQFDTVREAPPDTPALDLPGFDKMVADSPALEWIDSRLGEVVNGVFDEQQQQQQLRRKHGSGSTLVDCDGDGKDARIRNVGHTPFAYAAGNESSGSSDQDTLYNINVHPQDLVEQPTRIMLRPRRVMSHAWSSLKGSWRRAIRIEEQLALNYGARKDTDSTEFCLHNNENRDSQVGQYSPFMKTVRVRAAAGR